jgi:hypothetical protein
MTRAVSNEVGAEREGSSPRAAALPLLVIAVATLARATRLGESLWYDEIAAWRQFGVEGPWFIVTHYFDPANHVAHTVASWASVTMLEPLLGSELALRAPALLASLASVGVVLGLARLAGGARAGLIAAGLAAVLPVSVLEGVEARGYSMMILFAAGASWAWCAAWRRPGPATWIAYAALVTIGTWTHPMTVFVPLGHGAWLLATAVLRRDGPLLAGAVALGLAAAFTLALYAPLLPQMLELRRGLRAATADQPGLLGPEGWHALLQLGGAWSWWGALPGAALLVAGLVACRRRPDARHVVLVSAAGLPLLVAAVLVTGTWVYARFMLFVLPAAIVLMALGADRLLAKRRALGVIALAAVAAAAAADLALRPPKQPLRDAAAWVAARSEPGAPVVVIGLAHRVLDAYAGDLDLRYSLRHGADLAEQLDDAQPRSVIGYYPRHISAAARSALEERGFTVARRFPGWADWGNGEVIVWER